MNGHRSRARFGSGWFFAGGLAVVVVIGIVAIVISRDAGDDADAVNGEEGREIAASVSLDGQSLPVHTGDGEDPAVGQAAPVAVGGDFDDHEVRIARGDTAQLVVFLAHWCPHCQAEVPRLVEFAAAGGFPVGLEMIAVATGTSSDRDNYPPSEWLAREGWTSPVLVDTSNGSVANAYGLSSYPYFVLLDADGNVLARDAGELTEAQLRELVALAVASMDEGPDGDDDLEVDEPAGPPAPGVY